MSEAAAGKLSPACVAVRISDDTCGRCSVGTPDKLISQSGRNQPPSLLYSLRSTLPSFVPLRLPFPISFIILFSSSVLFSVFLSPPSLFGPSLYFLVLLFYSLFSYTLSLFLCLSIHLCLTILFLSLHSCSLASASSLSSSSSPFPFSLALFSSSPSLIRPIA